MPPTARVAHPTIIQKGKFMAAVLALCSAALLSVAQKRHRLLPTGSDVRIWGAIRRIILVQMPCKYVGFCSVWHN
ncbi:hypothetical protein B0T14DRAFT_513665 [Immersiella caudata]|uniref:Uncharacterized protein n=1 Tax=Immersiella caudata TaxID=314043 RepID=A0AA40C269_9PEZI|nr:hypothetical protein B0T14DRAFT_513665 [Immersiella caudata]